MQMAVKKAAPAAGLTQGLSEFLAGITYDQLPEPVVARTEELFLDWLASALASRGARPITVMEQFAGTMGPQTGPAEIFTSRKRTSPFFAALVNGAASHFVEQDDCTTARCCIPGRWCFRRYWRRRRRSMRAGRN